MFGRHHQVAAAAVLLACAASVAAQDSVTGRYSGSLIAQMSGRDVNIGLTMVIASVENGRVKGVATMGGMSCSGDYPFEGYLKGTELAVRSDVKGGRAGDCTFAMKGTLEGNKITGTAGRYPLQLSK